MLPRYFITFSKLDIFKNSKGDLYAALTSKNVGLIATCCASDPKYKTVMLPNKKTIDALGSVFGCTVPKIFYAKTTKYSDSDYWFDYMIKNPTNYQLALKALIISIDRVNSTHLYTSASGIINTYNRILKKCPSLTDLKKELSIGITKTTIGTHLFSELCEPLTPKRKVKKVGATNINLSFASKFCSWCSIKLNGKDLFPRYDGIVKNNLAFYQINYLGSLVFPEKTYIPSGKYATPILKKKAYLDCYLKYIDCIDTILASLKPGGISYSDFDRVVWYTNK